MFGRKNKAAKLPKGPKLSDAVAGAQKDALAQQTLSGIRAVVTDNLNQKQFKDYSYLKMNGLPLPEEAQARIDRYNESRDKTNRFGMLSGLSRVSQHDAEMDGMRRAYEKLTPPDTKAEQVLLEARSGKSFEQSAAQVRKSFAEMDKKFPNSYEKWAD